MKERKTNKEAAHPIQHVECLTKAALFPLQLDNGADFQPDVEHVLLGKVVQGLEAVNLVLDQDRLAPARNSRMRVRRNKLSAFPTYTLCKKAVQ